MQQHHVLVAHVYRLPIAALYFNLFSPRTHDARGVLFVKDQAGRG